MKGVKLSGETVERGTPKQMKITLALAFALSAAQLAAAADTPPALDLAGADVAAVMAHIRKGFPASVKINKEGDKDIVGLPHPYTSPCVKEGFQQLFYWDTFFINQGLLRLGMAEQARNKEQTFWESRRMSPCGLNRSGNEATEKYLLSFYSYLARERFKGIAFTNREDKLAFSRQALSEAETWDFTPRFDRRAEEYCAVDLNGCLYACELNLAWCCGVLKNGEEREWLAKAERRKALMQSLLWNESVGCYVDFDWKSRKQGDLVSCAALFPLLAGVATPAQAERVVRAMREKLECAHGLATCEKRAHPFVYQWDYPNAWPPMQLVAIDALDRYGFKEDARRIAAKYVRTVALNFKRTGDLWEKYNAVEGTTEVKDEYQMPRMMGWTAGVFVRAVEYLDPALLGTGGTP